MIYSDTGKETLSKMKKKDLANMPARRIEAFVGAPRRERLPKACLPFFMATRPN